MHAAYYAWRTVWMSRLLVCSLNDPSWTDTAGSVVVRWSPWSMDAHLHLAQEGVVGVED